jgi:hypothetical protein
MARGKEAGLIGPNETEAIAFSESANHLDVDGQRHDSAGWMGGHGPLGRLWKTPRRCARMDV